MVFVLQGEELSISQRLLEAGSAYFSELLKTPEEYPQVRILLPDWVSRRALMLYLDYIGLKRLPTLDVLTAQKLLWLADFLQDPQLQSSLLEDTILPHLTKDSVLLFLQDAHTKLSQGSDNPIWKQLLLKCIDLAASESAYLFSRFKASILAMAPELVEQLIYRALVQASHHSASDNTDLLTALKTIKGVESWVEMLGKEQERALGGARWRRDRKPVFVWDLEGIQLDNYFRESESFEVAGMAWTVSVWSFAHENKLDIAIRNTPSQSPGSFPRHSLIALSCSCQLDSEPLPSPLLITALIGTKTQNLIRSLHPASSLSLSRLSLSIHIEVEYVYSALLTYIVKHPGQCLAGSIGALEGDKLLVVLKHRYLAVETEDEVLGLVGRWYQEASPEGDICDLLEAIRWPFVTLKGVIGALRDFPALKNSKCFRELFRRELDQRAVPKRDSEAPLPRHSYKNDSNREIFPSQKKFLETLAELLLELEFNPEAESVISRQERAALEAEMELSLAQRDKEIKELESAIFALERKNPPINLQNSYRDVSPNLGIKDEYSEEEDVKNASFLSAPRRPMRLHPRSTSHEGRRSLSRSALSTARPKIKAVVEAIRNKLPASGRSSALSRLSDLR